VGFCAAAHVPGGQRAAGGALDKSCRILATCWALVGMAGCAYLSLSSTLPVTTLGDPFLWGPDWLQSVAVSGAIVLGLPWLAVPVALLFVGLVRLHRARHGRRRWQAAWVVAVAVAVSVEAMLVTGFDVASIAPNYQGPALVSWIWLAESAGCLAVGAAMLAVLARATQKPDHLHRHG